MTSTAGVLGTGAFTISVIWFISANPAALWHHQVSSKIAPYTLQRQAVSDPNQEIAFYRKRVKQDPQGFLDLISLAQVYLRRAKATGESSWYLLAEQAAQRSLKNFPNNPGALLLLARIAQARHDFQASLNLVRLVDASHPGDLGVQSNYVTIYLGLGENQAAAKAADILVTRSPGLEAYTQRALVRISQGRENEAIADFKHGLLLEQAGQMDASAQARAWLARLYAHRGHSDWARDLLQEALRIQPDQPLTLGLLADLEMREKHDDLAAQYYANAFQRSQSPVYLIRQAHAMQRMKQPSQASALEFKAETLLRRDLASGSFGHRRDLARLILERGRKIESPEALSLMQSEIKKRQDADTLNVFAWSLAQAGRWQEAQKTIKQALNTDIQDAELLYRAAQISAALGQSVEAEAYQQKADKLDPGFHLDPAFKAFGGASD